MTNNGARDVRRIDSLQVLRAVAALMVVFHHAMILFTKHVPESTSFGTPQILGPIIGSCGEVFSSGVDIFFVLSGFIMVYIARPYAEGKKSVADFAMRRLIRIYPIYFLITIYFAVHHTQITTQPAILVRSLLFIPYESVPGGFEPVLGVAWTLYFEMLFYMYFAITLVVARNRLVPGLLAIVLSGMAIACVLSAIFGERPTFRMMSSPIIIEFLFGCLVGSWWKSKSMKSGQAGRKSIDYDRLGVGLTLLGTGMLVFGVRTSTYEASEKSHQLIADN